MTTKITPETFPAYRLGMGDRYRRIGKDGILQDEIITVSDTDQTVDRGIWIWVEGRVRHTFERGARVVLVAAAPRCGCGKRFERCWDGCAWPQWAKDASSGRPVAMPGV
jgi:hypothetical protein